MVTWYIVGIPTKTNFEHFILLLLLIGGLFRAMAQMKACNFLRPPSKYLLNFKSKFVGKIGQKSDIASLTGRKNWNLMDLQLSTNDGNSNNLNSHHFFCLFVLNHLPQEKLLVLKLASAWFLEHIYSVLVCW